ncbi:MAG TPA: EamA family transporter [Anaerolineae bacterium]|nr:EamA family transporter [Anaerolineae bacterium]
MSGIAIVLLVTSAFMHAFWNFISKKQSPSLSFFWITTISGALIMSPFLWWQRGALPLLPLSVWGLILLTGMAQAVYFSGLAGAYRRGDMSLAYPLARALPVLAVAGINFLMGKGGEIGGIGLLGMILISIGCIILPLPQFRRLGWRDYADEVYLLAVVAAIGTTAYTLIDDAVLRQMRAIVDSSLGTTGVTLLFISLQTVSTSLMLGLVAVGVEAERAQLRRLLADRKMVVTGLVTGVVIMGTYGLVLASMAYVRNVSYVAAFRQLSIPIGAVLGLVWQGEARHRPKLVGIGVISIGLILVGVG